MAAAETVVAVIPARGGSKGVPRKNVLQVDGHPLIAYSIAAGLASGADHVICTTDDDEIAEVAEAYGAEILRRPAHLAADDTPDLPVFEHALAALRGDGVDPTIVVQLRPTAPLRPQGLVDRCVAALLADPVASSVRTVAPAPHTPYKMWRPFAAGDYLEPLLELPGCAEPYNLPRQSLPQAWWHNGSVDVIRAAVLDGGSMTGPRIVPVAMDLGDSVDIDDELALATASVVMSRRDDICRPLSPMWLRTTDLVLCDVDGTLTPGTMHYSANGEELKSFHTRDGLGARLLGEAGIVVGLVTGESSPIVRARAAKLHIEHVVLGADDKRLAVGRLLAELDHDGRHAVFLGDDVNDLPAAELVHERGGRFVAVADAHPSVRRAADLVLSSVGGAGALRELADLILSSRQPGAARPTLCVRTPSTIGALP